VPAPRLPLPDGVALLLGSMAAALVDVTGKPPRLGLASDEMRSVYQGAIADGCKAEQGLTGTPYRAVVEAMVASFKQAAARRHQLGLRPAGNATGNADTRRRCRSAGDCGCTASAKSDGPRLSGLAAWYTPATRTPSRPSPFACRTSRSRASDSIVMSAMTAPI
jgi:hypothetical protein